MKNLSFIFSIILTFHAYGKLPLWSYDKGPVVPEKGCSQELYSMNCELIDLTARIPNMPALSDALYGRSQKFRPAFGPIPWRMRLEKDAVKILFMGQDGTHIAEAAGRPATAGFGGRAQDFANFFGVDEGAAFINAYSFTIKGQYGIYNSPYVYTNGEALSIRKANIVSNELWSLSMDQRSPITQWRNDLIDWIIKNNKNSMKLIVLFGGAARDAIATYVESKGGDVRGRYEDHMTNIQVPLTKSEYAGGNNTFPSLVSKSGRDLYEEMLGKKLSYSSTKNQKEVQQDLKSRLTEYLKEMVFTQSGPYKNGLMNSAQIGGFDLDTMTVNGVETRSLKGLKLNDGSVIENDIIVISLPHPSSLSRTVMDADDYYTGKKAASARVMKDVRVLKKYVDAGWKITADPGKINHFAEGEDYNYGRSDIGPEFYDFGTPKNRMVSKSTAKRMSGNANVVIIGTRDNGEFSKSKIKEMTKALPGESLVSSNLFIARPRSIEERYVFDSGPGEKMAKIMKTNLNFKAVFTEKTGMNFKNDGIKAYDVKSHPDVGDFGHYRGTFNNPEVVILADPDGYDDIITARALTGTRGQYLQSLMSDIGVNDNYLVIKTVPFAMDGASEDEWARTLARTEDYRKEILTSILSKNRPKIILTDGLNAKKALDPLLYGDIPVVSLTRKPGIPSFGINKAFQEIKKLSLFKVQAHNTRMLNIPRTHLSFYARVWEGTSGDRVITSAGTKYEGLAFAEVVPSWTFKQKAKLTDINQIKIERLLKELLQEGYKLPYETVPHFLKRQEKSALTLNELFMNAI